MRFTIYVADLFQIIEKHLPEARGYADDHQVYLSFRPIPFTNQTASVAAIENCAAEQRSWMISNMLMVNGSKTKLLVVGSKQQLEHVNTPFIHVGEDQITRDVSAKPGCDFWLQLENGYANLKSPPKHLLSSPQHQENPKIPEPGSHVHDYTCIYYKPDWLLQQFDELTTRESHQETPACAKHSCQTSVQSEEIWSHNSCITLHWLPVKYQIELKTLLIVFKGLHGKAPTYIQEMIIPSKSKRYSIRSNEERVLKVPKFKHDHFRQACIRSVWASGMELLAKGN